MRAELDNFLKPDDFGRATFVGDNPKILDLSPKERLLVAAWRHACVIPEQVSREYGIKWTIQRYSECNFVFGLIREAARDNRELYCALVSPTQRLHDEPVGRYEKGRVPKSHKKQMSPLSTFWGYSLPRVLIEEMGRGENRSWARYKKALEILDEAAMAARTPIELLVIIAREVTKADADFTVVLGHILPRDILLEENCQGQLDKLAKTLKRRAPMLWRCYKSLTPRQKQKEGMVELPLA